MKIEAIVFAISSIVGFILLCCKSLGEGTDIDEDELTKSFKKK